MLGPQMRPGERQRSVPDLPRRGNVAHQEVEITPQRQRRNAVDVLWRRAVPDGQRAIDERSGIGITSRLAVQVSKQFERSRLRGTAVGRLALANAPRFVERRLRTIETFEANQRPRQSVET